MEETSPVTELVKRSWRLEQAGEIAPAFECAKSALERARGLGVPAAVAEALIGLAYLQFRLGRYSEAISLARQALDPAPPASFSRADALLTLGMCYAESLSLDEAEQYFLAAADLGREIGYSLVRLRALHNLAVAVYIPRGQYHLALDSDEKACHLAREGHLAEWLHGPLTSIAWACQLTGQIALARQAIDELDCVALPNSLARGYFYYLDANQRQDEGQADLAPALYTQALSIAEKIGEPGLNIEVRLGMSRALRRMGHPTVACEWADAAVKIAVQVGYQHFQGRALVDRGHATMQCGEAGAEQDFRQAIAIFTSLGTMGDLAHAWLLLAALLHRQGAPEALAAWLEAGRHILAGGYYSLLDRERKVVYPLVEAKWKCASAQIIDINARLLQALKETPAHPLKITVLGGFEIHRGGRRVNPQDLRQRKAGELFALLILAPSHTLLAEEVIERIWPGHNSGTGQALLHHATSALRKALEPELPEDFPSRYLHVERGMLTLYLPKGSLLDVEEFERAMRADQWENALSAYGGSLLPNFGYEEWCLARRERLAQLFQQVLLRVAEERLERGSPAEALEACHSLLALEPWQEQAVWLGMRACHTLDDRAGAIRLYQDLEKSLRDDLSIAPRRELQELYRSLLIR